MWLLVSKIFFLLADAFHRGRLSAGQFPRSPLHFIYFIKSTKCEMLHSPSPLNGLHTESCGICQWKEACNHYKGEDGKPTGHLLMNGKARVAWQSLFTPDVTLHHSLAGWGLRGSVGGGAWAKAKGLQPGTAPIKDTKSVKVTEKKTNFLNRRSQLKGRKTNLGGGEGRAAARATVRGRPYVGEAADV